MFETSIFITSTVPGSVIVLDSATHTFVVPKWSPWSISLVLSCPGVLVYPGNDLKVFPATQHPPPRGDFQEPAGLLKFLLPLPVQEACGLLTLGEGEGGGQLLSIRASRPALKWIQDGMCT